MNPTHEGEPVLRRVSADMQRRGVVTYTEYAAQRRERGHQDSKPYWKSEAEWDSIIVLANTPIFPRIEVTVPPTAPEQIEAPAPLKFFMRQEDVGSL